MSTQDGVSLGEQLKQVLSTHVHAWSCRQTETADPGWTVEALAHRHMLRLHFPTTVWQGCVGDRTVAWIETGHRAKQWSVTDAPVVPSDLRREVESRPNPVYKFGPGHMWVTDPVLGPLSFTFSLIGRETIGHLFANDLCSLIARWKHEQEQSYERIKYRPLNLRIPCDPEPDARLRAVATAEVLPPRPLVYNDIVRRVEDSRLLRCVPEDVATVWERAVRLFLWGYQEWDFFTVAEHYLGLAADTSLRALRAHSWSYPAHIDFLSTSSPQSRVVQGFIARDPSDARLWYTPPGARARRVNGALVDLRKTALLQWAQHEQLVSAREAAAIETAFTVRDMMSHPNRSNLSWIGHVAALLASMSEAINGMWARRVHPRDVPWESDFAIRPRWSKLHPLGTLSP